MRNHYLVSLVPCLALVSCVERQFNSQAETKSGYGPEYGKWQHSQRFVAKGEKNAHFNGTEIWFDYILNRNQIGSFRYNTTADEIFAHVKLPSGVDCNRREGWGEVVLTSYVVHKTGNLDYDTKKTVTTKGPLKSDGECTFTTKLGSLLVQDSGKELEAWFSQRFSVVLDGYWLFDGGGSNTNDFNFTIVKVPY